MTFIVAALLLGQSVLADVVFFDFNNGPLEIAAAQRAARKRGERLIVYPMIPAETRTRLRGMGEQLRAIETQMNAATNSEQRRQLEMRYRELDATRNQLSQGTRFGAEETKKAIADLEARGVKVSSLILSGHDGNGDFSGTQGGLHSRDLKEILKAHPAFAANIKSLFLAGCYTATPGMLEYTWQDAIPNLKAVAGYPGSAPAVDKIAGHQFLERFLSGEARLLAANSPAQIRAIAGGMIPPHVHSTAAICLPGKKYFHRNQYRDLEEEWKSCPATLETLARNKETFLCYMEARPGCEDPPADSQSGPLREYYRALQAVQPCRHNPQFARQMGELFDGESMIRLIYHKNVRRNFASQYRTQLEETKAMLLAAGVPEELANKVTNIANMNRRQILDMIAELEEFHNVRRSGGRDLPADDSKAAALVAMNYVVDTLKKQLSHMDPSCVPFHWVEPNSTARSQCRIDSNLGNRAWELARQQTPIYRMEGRMNQLRREYDRALNGGREEPEPLPPSPAPTPTADGGPGADGRSEPPPADQVIPYQMPQDHVISDDAVMSTITNDQHRQYELRMQALQREREVLQAEFYIRHRANDPDYARDVQTYRQNIDQMRERARAAAEAARQLAPPLDARALRQNRREFFATALSVLPDLSVRRNEIAEMRQKIENLRRSADESTNPQVRQNYLDDIASSERYLVEMNRSLEQQQQHREYVERMSRVMSGTPEAADQERIAQLVLQRVRDGRQEQIVSLSYNIEHHRAYMQSCASRPATDRCHREMPVIRGHIAGFTQALASLQRDVDLNDHR